MPSTEEREAQPVMGDPCPKCGASLVLRNWKGQFFTKCTNAGCTYGYDTDNRGRPAALCPACGTGRMRSGNGIRVCADCGAEERAGSVPPPAAAESPAPELGTCPKCGKGQLAVRSGAYGTFVSCSARCGLSYSSDEQGVPSGGLCKACQGPVKKTQSGSRVCALCGTWQDEKKPAASAPAPDTRPAKPKAANCPRCARPLKQVFTRRQKWMYRCDTCEAWYDA